MLAFKLVVFALVISTGVLGRNTHRINTRHTQAEDEYKYNHPPTPEVAIPVAVVYEHESNREDKSIKGNVTPEHNTNEVSKEPLNSESGVKQEPRTTVTINNDEIEIKKPTNSEEKEPKVTTYRPQKERQIPVAVLYEPEPTNQKPRSNRNRATNRSRRIQSPALEEKHTDEEENISSNAQVNGHTGPGLITSSNKNEDSGKRRKNRRPVPEKQTNVKDSTPSTIGGNAYIPLSSSTIKTEEPNKLQKPTDEEPKIPLGNTISPNSTVNEQEKINTREKIQPVRAEIKMAKEDSKNRPSPPENGNTSVLKADKSGQSNTDNLQLLKRDNSTQVREIVPIVQSENVVFSHSGNFKYSYEGGDGTKAFEAGELKTFDDDTAGEAVSGGFSYTAKDGNEYSLSYTADENGYRPVGAHLPTPPPIPPAIARALAYLATKTTPEPVTESLAEHDQKHTRRSFP
ncbi:probable serine/threonine-protein kinase kinX [Cydia pomonella]|uniref:probable serine/threonine-protein kinase kinX n=1 Tax=Cydia pomonella TaxID=82600 RepID=UPI002ADDEE47|nr:probable serine/threonine-protein kinase kinX [Cydia pomonella]